MKASRKPSLKPSRSPGLADATFAPLPSTSESEQVLNRSPPPTLQVTSPQEVRERNPGGRVADCVANGFPWSGEACMDHLYQYHAISDADAEHQEFCLRNADLHPHVSPDGEVYILSENELIVRARRSTSMMRRHWRTGMNNQVRKAALTINMHRVDHHYRFLR
jgi:hypothetical protein